MKRDHHDVIRQLRRHLQETPSGRVVVCSIELEDEGPPIREKVTFITEDDFEQIGDSVAVADQLLRHVGQLLAMRTNDDWARERLAKIETARAALDFEKRQVSS